MPLQEFWYDDPELLWVYRFSYEEKMKEKAMEQNSNAWLYGYYNYIAINAALSKNGKYLDKPIELNKEEKKDTKLDIANRIKANMARAKQIIKKER
jgi:hypothetical protein